MSAICELAYSPFSKNTGDSQGFSIQYIISGTDDVNEAYDALRSEAPTRLGTLYPHQYDVKPRQDADDLFDGEVSYQPNKPSTEPTYNIEIGVAQAKFTQSLMTVARYGVAGQPIPNFQGAIGVTKEGVEGCDVQVPSMIWNERHIISNNRIANAFIQQIFVCCARMNDSQFRIFARGEALFLGATLAQSKEVDGWEGNFRWAGSPNAVGLSVGNITIAEKLGHDYLWIRYQESTSAGSSVKIPKSAFVERVYQFTDMNALRLEDPT